MSFGGRDGTQVAARSFPSSACDVRKAGLIASLKQPEEARQQIILPQKAVFGHLSHMCI